MTSLLLFVGGFVTGALGLICYGCYRGVNSKGWDDSNMLNWIRLFSHIVAHPEDFAQMYYPLFTDGEMCLGEKPFPYLSKDEFSENFPTSRPPK